jgi:hypothetical protein
MAKVVPSCVDHDLLHHMKADHFGHLIGLKVGCNSILHVRLQLLDIIPISKDGVVLGMSLVSAFGRLFNNEDDLRHAPNLQQELVYRALSAGP